jgi:hypothetical protein
MTQVERKIHQALDADATLDQLALLYSQASSASFNVYSRIDWKQLESAIELKRGKAGLVYVMLESQRKQ